MVWFRPQMRFDWSPGIAMEQQGLFSSVLTKRWVSTQRLPEDLGSPGPVSGSNCRHPRGNREAA